MTDDEWRELGISTDEEIKERENYFKKLEDDGIIDTQKYFDRIHDKLFNFNNILIAAYFALIAIQKNVPEWIFIVPILNSLLLLNIDYRMLKRARIQSRITEVSGKKREKYGSIQTVTNLYSLISIYSTIIVLLIFGYFLFFNNKL